MTRPRVLVTAVGGNVGQGVVKALRASSRNFYIVGIDMEALSAGFSLTDRYYVTPSCRDSSFRQAIGGIVRREHIEAIYVSSPAELEFFTSNKSELESTLGASVFVNPPEVVRVGSDKLLTAEFLRDAGLPFPASVLSTAGEGLDSLIRTHGFPLVVKPRADSSSRNVFVVTSREQIVGAAALVPDLIVQRYLGDAEHEFSAATLSGADRRVRAVIIMRRHLLQGTTYRTELAEDETLRAQIVCIVERLGAVGPCNVQFRVVDGAAIAFDINPRFSGTSGVRYLYGFNDCEMIFDLLRLGSEIRQPELTRAVVLRYWSEVCVPGADFADLAADRTSQSRLAAPSRNGIA